MVNVRPPWLYLRPRQPDDSPLGFHVARETLQGAQPDTSTFAIQPYPQDTNGLLGVSSDFAGALRPPDGSRKPLDFLTGQNIGSSSPNHGLPLPSLTSLLFPRMGEPQSATPGLQDFEPPPAFVPGFHVEPAADDRPGFRVDAGDIGQNSLPDDVHNWAFGYNPDVGNLPDVGTSTPEAQPSDEESFYSVPPAAYDPVYFPEPPRDRIKEALDQIARIYRGVLPDLFGRPTSRTGHVLADDTDASPTPFIGNDTLDQRLICLLYTSPSPRDGLLSRMPSSA